MLQQLLPLLGSGPDNVKVFLEVALVICVLGSMVWLMGARYSRQMVTLAGVAIGTLVGKHLREFVPVNLSGAALAVAGALVCGVVAFVTHRLWIGLMLGGLLACWTALATWAQMHGQQSWSQPVWDADMTPKKFATDLWIVLPPEVTRIMPWAAGVALVSGVALAIVWPRLATALNWSLAGLTLVLGVGLAAVVYARPQWLGLMPAQTWSQLTAFVGLILFGALTQWKLAPRGAMKVQVVSAQE